MVDLKADFDQARLAYRKAGGVTRGLDTEYGYYLRILKNNKLKEYDITPKLIPAIQAQIDDRKRKGKDPYGYWKHFKSWIYNIWWEAVDCKEAKDNPNCCWCKTTEWSIVWMGKPICSNPVCRKAVRGY